MSNLIKTIRLLKDKPELKELAKIIDWHEGFAIDTGDGLQRAYIRTVRDNAMRALSEELLLQILSPNFIDSKYPDYAECMARGHFKFLTEYTTMLQAERPHKINTNELKKHFDAAFMANYSARHGCNGFDKSDLRSVNTWFDNVERYLKFIRPHTENINHKYYFNLKKMKVHVAEQRKIAAYLAGGEVYSGDIPEIMLAYAVTHLPIDRLVVSHPEAMQGILEKLPKHIASLMYEQNGHYAEQSELEDYILEAEKNYTTMISKMHVGYRAGVLPISSELENLAFKGLRLRCPVIFDWINGHAPNHLYMGTHTAEDVRSAAAIHYMVNPSTEKIKTHFHTLSANYEERRLQYKNLVLPTVEGYQVSSVRPFDELGSVAHWSEQKREKFLLDLEIKAQKRVLSESIDSQKKSSILKV